MKKGIILGVVIALLVQCSCTIAEQDKGLNSEWYSGYYGHYQGHPSSNRSIWETLTPSLEASEYLLQSGQIDIKTFRMLQIKRGDMGTRRSRFDTEGWILRQEMDLIGGNSWWKFEP
jgi:hypothetical protein